MKKSTLRKIDRLVRAALDVQDCNDLSEEQKFIAEKAYNEASKLEEDVQATIADQEYADANPEPAEAIKRAVTGHSGDCPCCGLPAHRAL